MFPQFNGGMCFCSTKQNCENNNFQTGFLTTPPTCHWLGRQIVPPPNSIG